jgi:hypothetical protein
MTALRVSRQLTGPAGKFCFKLATLPGRVVGQRRQQCPSAIGIRKDAWLAIGVTTSLLHCGWLIAARRIRQWHNADQGKARVLCRPRSSKSCI